jgi:Carboxypeptidase regulatory-like domain/TonB dependent receptor
MIRVCLALCSLVFLLTGEAEGQEQSSIRGTAVDESSAVLPGVTVTATEMSTGRQHVTVTDERGEYRLPGLPAGTYDVRAELTGFAIVVISKVELLVGQNATIGLNMRVATVQETITVSGESPLVDITSSQIAGNVDRRQMEELPILGRNWMELALQVRGITANNVGDRPGVERDDRFQLNLDGQQVTQKVSGSDRGQPKFSREAIAEFQIATNMFDVTDGRSMGIQVRAVTRSGTNNIQGSVYGYFRDDAFNAADHVVNSVLPYENQQLGGAVGGPIVRDRAHYFFTYEYEREPSTIISQPPQLPSQTFIYPSKLGQNSLLGRFDQTLTERDHLSVRVSAWDLDSPFELGSSAHPSQALSRTQNSVTVLGTWARVLNDRALQEFKFGYNQFDWDIFLAFPEMANTPQLVFSGLTVGGSRNYPQDFHERQASARYDLTLNRDRHDLKIGGEFLYWHDTGVRELVSRGEFIFSRNPPDLERRFPSSSADDPAGWDLTGLDPLAQRYDLNVGDWSVDIPRPNWAVWVGDTWRVNERLTVNMGVRWDVDWGILDPPDMNSAATFDPVGGVPHNSPPFASDSIAIQAGDRIFRTGMRDLNNVAPRVGFAYQATGTDDFVIRGGTGIFYTSPMSNLAYGQQSFNLERVLANTFPNDGRPGFIDDPTSCPVAFRLHRSSRA